MGVAERSGEEGGKSMISHLFVFLDKELRLGMGAYIFMTSVSTLLFGELYATISTALAVES